MEHNQIVAKLTEIFQDIFEDPSLELSDSMTALDVPGWDSLSHINLILAVEKGFNVQLTTREVRGLENVGAFIHLIEKKVG
jgi:acyl carrier protein